jgi:long-chain acyl-CoA synthetase
MVAIGEPGELIARGPLVMPGYWRQPGETENVLRERDGWLTAIFAAGPESAD